jgi:hypothetical protein
MQNKKRQNIKTKKLQQKQIRYNTRKHYTQFGGNYNTKFLTSIKVIANQIQPNFNNDEFYSKFDFNQLVIKNHKFDIYTIYRERQYLELRPYNGEKVLIIACGNRRLDNGNLDIINNNSHPKEEQIDFNLYHSHDNAYTIDMSLTANPSIVSTWEEKTFTTIPDNSFDFILFEGGARPHSNPDEIERLLNKNNYSMCICDGEIQKYGDIPLPQMVVYSYYHYGIYYKVNNLEDLDTIKQIFDDKNASNQSGTLETNA